MSPPHARCVADAHEGAYDRAVSFSELSQCPRRKRPVAAGAVQAPRAARYGAKLVDSVAADPESQNCERLHDSNGEIDRCRPILL